jgi:hypothetical protein
MDVPCMPGYCLALKIGAASAWQDMKWASNQSQPTLRGQHILDAADIHDPDALYWPM